MKFFHSRQASRFSMDEYQLRENATGNRYPKAAVNAIDRAGFASLVCWWEGGQFIWRASKWSSAVSTAATMSALARITGSGGSPIGSESRLAMAYMRRRLPCALNSDHRGENAASIATASSPSAFCAARVRRSAGSGSRPAITLYQASPPAKSDRAAPQSRCSRSRTPRMSWREIAPARRHSPRRPAAAS